MSEDRDDNPLEQLVELLVYAPVGLLYEYEDVLPKLVRRGKSQVALARFFGQAAMRKGSSTAEGVVGDAVAAGANLLARALTEFGAAVGLAPDQTAESRTARSGPSTAAPAAGDGRAEQGPSAAGSLDDGAGEGGGAGPDADGGAGDGAVERDARAGGTDPASAAGGGVAADGGAVAVDGPGIDLAAEVAASGEAGGSADSSGGTAAAGPAPSTGQEPEGTGALPIAGYDELTARVVVSLLDDLSPAQRARVRHHEEANRARKTVLAKLDRLDRP